MKSRSIPAVFLFAFLLCKPFDLNAQSWSFEGLDMFVELAKASDSLSVAITNEGLVLRTTDLWKTWSSQRIDTAQSFKTIAFASKNNGFILGYHFYYSSQDAGLTWKRTRYPYFEQFHSLVGLPDGTFRFLDAKGRIYSSTNPAQGQWVDDSLPLERLQAGYDGTLVGLTIGKRVMLSTDGGESWSMIKKIPLAYACIFTNRMYGSVSIAASPHNYNLITKDGGNTWDTIYSYWPASWALDSVTMRFGDVIYSFVHGVIDSSNVGIGNTYTMSEFKVGNDVYRIFGKHLQAASIFTQEFKQLLTFQYESGYRFHVLSPGVLRRASSDQIFKSLDTGHTWVFDGDTLKNAAYSHTWVSDSVGYYHAIDTLFITRDKGKTRHSILTINPETDQFTNIQRRGKSYTDSVIYVITVGRIHIIEGTSVVTRPIPLMWANRMAFKGSKMVIVGVDSLENRRFFVSNDLGLTWIERDVDYTEGVWVPDEQSIARRTQNKLQISTDDGQSWKTIKEPANPHYICFLSRDSIVSNDDTIFITTDGGKTWSERKSEAFGSVSGEMVVSDRTIFFFHYMSLVHISIDDLFKTPKPKPVRPKVRWVLHSGQSISVGESPNGTWLQWTNEGQYRIMRSTNLGATWTRSDSSAPEGYSRFYTAGNEVFTSSEYRGTNQGRSWKQVNMHQSANNITQVLYGVHNRLFASHEKGVSYSNDQGKFWGVRDTMLANIPIKTMVRHPKTNHLYALSDRALYKMLDDGSDWELVYKRTEHENPFSTFAILPSGKMYLSAGSDFFRSTDNGFSWIGLTRPGNILMLLPINDSLLFTLVGLSSSTYLYYTMNEGMEWIQCDTIKEGVTDLKLMQNGYLAAATKNHGVVRTYSTVAEPKAYVNDSKEEVLLTIESNVWPNPTSETLHVNPTIADIGSTIDIYDVTGQLRKRHQLDSSHQINVSDLLSGSYYLVAGNARMKFVVQR